MEITFIFSMDWSSQNNSRSNTIIYQRKKKKEKIETFFKLIHVVILDKFSKQIEKHILILSISSQKKKLINFFI